MRSFSLQGMRKHPALIPLVVIVGVGMAGAGFYTARLALRSPEVSWNKKTNPEPWQEFQNKQYKFYSTKDYSAVPRDQRPEF
uniref:Putative nadh dehydrogenase n=1 Tax=Amblyomma parvum TaxID=251391 RepID=A0A023G0S8_AMBPA